MPGLITDLPCLDSLRKLPESLQVYFDPETSSIVIRDSAEDMFVQFTLRTNFVKALQEAIGSLLAGIAHKHFGNLTISIHRAIAEATQSGSLRIDDKYLDLLLFLESLQKIEESLNSKPFDWAKYRKMFFPASEPLSPSPV